MKYVYIYAVQFLEEGWPPLLLCLPLYLLWRLTVLFPMGTEGRLRTRRWDHKEWLRLILFCYLILLFTQTFSQRGENNSLCPIPFYIIVTEIMESSKNNYAMRMFVLNVIGNVAVFVPVGWLTAALNGGQCAETIGTGFRISLLIELAQLPMNRTSDVDDLILNTTGAAIGYGCYRLFNRIRSRA